MSQRLLVEGKDDLHVIVNLAVARGLPPILGYRNERRFKKEFAVIADGRDNLLNMKIPEILKENELKNFGIVIDANDDAQAKWDAVKTNLQQFGYSDLPIARPTDGVIEQAGKPKVGVWIMPDNENNGYLEHFLANIIQENDALFPIARESVQNLFNQGLNRFPEVRRQKSEIHTWLAWQETPGMPTGLSVSANYFDVNAPLANAFITWLQKVFEFE